MAKEESAKKELNLTEKSVLLILLAEGGQQVPNTVLTNSYRIKVATENRNKLQENGYVESWVEGNRRYWELRDAGATRALAEFGAEVPERAGAGGAALYAVLATIRRYLDKAGISQEEFFLPSGDTASARVGVDVEADDHEIERRVREAYGKLARKPGVHVKLADLRDNLGELPRDRVDAVLTVMNRTSTVNVVPESAQGTLTQRERDAAVLIGNQYKHVISIAL